MPYIFYKRPSKAVNSTGSVVCPPAGSNFELAFSFPSFMAARIRGYYTVPRFLTMLCAKKLHIWAFFNCPSPVHSPWPSHHCLAAVACHEWALFSENHFATVPHDLTESHLYLHFLSAPVRPDKQSQISFITSRSVSYNHLWFQFFRLWAFLVVSSRNVLW